MKRIVSMLVLLTVTVCFTPIAFAQSKPTFRLCTGSEDGNYFQAGHWLKRKSGAVNIEVLTSEGGLDNMAKLVDGKCDGAFVQNDTLQVYFARNAAAISTVERGPSLYREYLHLLCNRKSDIKSIKDLSAKTTVTVGPQGAGNRTTLDALKMANKKRYGDVATDDRVGERALAAIADGSTAQCGLFVQSLNSSFMKGKAATLGNDLVLVPTDDKELVESLKDNRGKPIYSIEEISGGDYPKPLARKGWFGGAKDLEMIGVEAIFVSNLNYIGANGTAYDKVLAAFRDARPEIAKIGRPQN